MLNKELFIGVLLYPLSKLIPIRKKHWVFGSDFGNMYREGSKYLMEYMLEHHPDYTCTFIARNKDVVQELRNKGIPVESNNSLRGIWKIMIADAVFTTQTISDVLYAYKKKGRKFFYLVHGQPFKCAMAMLPQSYVRDLVDRQNSLMRFVRKFEIGQIIKVGYRLSDVTFVSATSEFTAQFLRKEWPSVEIKILGMPRNDALFRSERMKKEKWFKGIEGKTVIAYMPTHRKYGVGDISPIPFVENKEAQEWMRQHNVVFLVKQHPNMVNRQKYHENEQSDVIIDISKMGFDPQVVIYHTDVLITDYSSVWMDYLLLKRPLLFYFYDDFETNDVGSYYNLRDEFPNNYCESETDLFQMIKKSIQSSSQLTPSASEIAKFHKYIDGNSCQRYFDAIVSDKKNEVYKK